MFGISPVYSYTVVRQTNTHFDALSASQVGVAFAVSLALVSTIIIDLNVCTQQLLPPPTIVRAPEDYRLQILSPTGCSRADCDLFIGIDTNAGDNGFLDIYMEGTAEGWVAVGFSETANMVSKINNKHKSIACICVLVYFPAFSGCGVLQQTGRNYCGH